MSHYREHFEDGEVLDEERLRARLAEVANARVLLDENPNADEDSPEQRAEKSRSKDPRELQKEDDFSQLTRNYLAWTVLANPDFNEYPEGESIQGILANLVNLDEYCPDEDCPESQAEDAQRAESDEHHEGEDHHEGVEEHGHNDSSHTHSHTHRDFSNAVGGLVSGHGEYRGDGSGTSVSISSLTDAEERVTSGFKMRTLTRPHEATDIGMSIGTRLYAPENGLVVHTGTASGYGNVAILSHGNGVYTAYAHLRNGGFVAEEGQTVRQGQVFALSGNTGIGTGPHLHMELILRDQNGTLRTVDARRADGRDLNDPAVRADLIQHSTATIGSRNGFNLAGRVAEAPEPTFS